MSKVAIPKPAVERRLEIGDNGGLTQPDTPMRGPAGASKDNEEVPEVFELRPLFSKTVVARVLDVRPARFYFVDDGEGLEDAED